MHLSTNFRILSLLVPIACVHATLYERIADLPANTYDFVIVGAGAGGSVLANRLSDNPATSVLLIEAGPTNIGVLDSIVPMLTQGLGPGSPWDWNFTTTPMEGLGGRSIPLPAWTPFGRFHLNQGTDTMAFTRGSFEEWDNYAKLSGDEGWSFDNMHEYFFRNEKWTAPNDNHTTRRFTARRAWFPSVFPGSHTLFDNAVIATTQEFPDDFPFNLDQNSGRPLGLGWPQQTIGGPARSSGATSYLAPQFLSRANLHVLTNTMVTKLVQTGTDGGKPAFRPTTTVTAKNEVILAAGAIGTPHLLMVSGIGPQEQLSALGIKTVLNNPAVGANLTDHPPRFEHVNATEFGILLEQWNTTHAGLLADSPLAHLVWSRLPNGSFTGPDTTPGPNTPHYELLFSNGFLSTVDTLPSTGSFMTIVTCLTAPSSRGNITLNTTNIFDPPIINPNMLATDFDVQAMVTAINATRKVVTAKAWDGYIIREFGDFAAATDEASLVDYVHTKATTIYHPIGGAVMSPKGASYGVVDPDGVVKGLSGLRIIDGSILPLIPSAHPQAFVYAVGERGADLVKEAYNC
ncbi:Choline dehydrogenase, mitochondrial [Mycena sanguinolenta]|uniref:Choline dehydrogenase, mitochondrial n=1 Tax=Mycena sanguinolenta TaxID=230812 RepID=A0A8H6Y2W8_9AGAR|nr:Choline dehydrogenase, mitochondrial [Mycena sanguinolenta]